jgi:hypothetical protein
MSTYTPKLVMLTGFNNRSYKYISKNRMRFIFLLIKRFSGGVIRIRFANSRRVWNPFGILMTGVPYYIIYALYSKCNYLPRYN